MRAAASTTVGRAMSHQGLAASLTIVLWLGIGCAGYRPFNEPLGHYDPAYGYRPETVMAARPPGDVLILLAFSGGGTRAAALSYGVLQELRDTEVTVAGVRGRLLDEVDTISSVSGGSFTSAYYGLFGDRIFDDFEERFLRRNVQRRLLLEMLRPKNWFRMASTFFDRSELAIEFYDREIFDRTTFADLIAAGSPAIQINAADIAVGDPFTFTQGQFDLICSDLSQLQVARAVAASSAVPVLLSPITLRNYAGHCDFVPPAWFEEALRGRQVSRRRLHQAEIAQSYLDSDARSYIHLVDGGIADNLGVRGPLDTVIESGGLWRRIQELGVERPSHVVIIVVDAAAQPDRHLNLSAASPSLGVIISLVTDVQLHRYNFETLELLRASLERWADEIPPDPAGEKLQTHLIEVSFQQIADPDERHFLNNLPTSFRLDDDEVDHLIAAGRELLRQSPAYQQLLADLGS